MIDQHPIRGEEQYSQLLHATETGLRSDRVGLLELCATLPFFLPWDTV